MKKSFAAALADALLSGPPDLAAAIERCAHALGSRPKWLKPELRVLIARFGGRWHWGIRQDLIEALLESERLDEAWKTRPLKIRRYVLTPPTMAPRPAALECAVPDLPTPAALANWLDVEIETLDAIVRSLQWRDNPREPLGVRHYRYRWQEKRSGGFRLLEMPKSRLRDWQRQILKRLLEYVPPHEAAKGFRRGQSALTHAAAHTGHRWVIRLDLEDFFLHVRAARVRAVFRTLGYPDGVADCLTALCTHRTAAGLLDGSNAKRAGESILFRPDHRLRQRYRSGHLPQGAPTSPALANLCAFRLDLRLAALAERFGANYTRYADDLAFSGDQAGCGAPERLIRLAGTICIEEGFAVNFRKTRLMSHGRRQSLAGAVVNEKVNVRRDDYDRIKAILHNCRKFGPASQTELDLPAFRDHLAGHIGHISALNSARGRRLREMWDAIDWGLAP